MTTGERSHSSRSGRRTASISGRTARVTSGGGEQDQILQTCGQIGALIIGQRHDRTSKAIEILQKQATAAMLRTYLDEWLPRFNERVAALERIVGRGLQLDGANLLQDLRAKVEAAGYDSMREFLTQEVLPLVSYHGVLLLLNNDARVKLPADSRTEVIQKMNAINKLVGSTCAAMVLQESMGV